LVYTVLALGYYCEPRIK